MTNKAGEQPTITQPVDVFAERKAFEAWWANWVPDGTMPSLTSHIFDAWLASARHRTTSLAAQDGLVEALETIEAEMAFPNSLELGFVHRGPTLADLQKRVELAKFIASQALSAIKGDKS